MGMERLQAKNNDIYEHTERLVTGWKGRGSNPGGSEIFRTLPDQPWGPSRLLYNGYRSLSLG